MRAQKEVLMRAQKEVPMRAQKEVLGELSRELGKVCRIKCSGDEE